MLSRYREGFVHKVYGSERGIGAPGQPVNRQDKNVRKWYLTIVRHGLYLLDAIHLVKVVGEARRSNADVIIMDRYIYDELANLPLTNFLSRIFVRVVDAFVPRPDIAYLLDADPVEACQRKPEYPIDFLRLSRRSYHRLAQMLGHMTVIPPLALPDALREVESAFAILIADEHAGKREQHRRRAGGITLPTPAVTITHQPPFLPVARSRRSNCPTESKRVSVNFCP